MLSNIVHNSHQLINSQYNDQDSLLCQLVKLKGRKRNFSFYQPSHKKGSIFQEPDFMHRMTFQSFRKGHRTYEPNLTFRKRTKSQESSKIQEKFKTQKSVHLRKPQIQTLEIKNAFKDNRDSKTIHSRKNNEWFGHGSNQKVHHQRVFSRKDKFTKGSELIQEPGLVNLCFYKNTLEQIESVKTARLLNRKRNSPKRQQRETSTRNKIKFVKYKGTVTDQNPECRPWSPKNDSEFMQSGEFPFFKSVFVKA